MGSEKIFLGGSRTVCHLTEKVVLYLDLFMDENAHFLIGDSYGANLVLQTYLSSKGYKYVTVFSSGRKAAFNLGNWDECHVIGSGKRHHSPLHRENDSVMIDECSSALLLYERGALRMKRNMHALKCRGVPIFTYYTDADKMKIRRRRFYNE